MRVIAPFLFAMLVVGTAAAHAEQTGDANAGHEFARRVCATCHAVEPGARTSPNPQAPTFQHVADAPGMTTMALAVLLRNPHRHMPDLILAPDDLSDVIAYVLDLRQKN
jgi:mono/diheme cytochrome c family protein